MKVMIAAAGTGGHVFPGLAVADQLQQYTGVQVVWLGTTQGKVTEWVTKAQLPLYTIEMQGLRGRGWLSWLKAPWQLLKATHQAWRILRQQRPDVLLVMGGYVSVPAGLAAKLLGIPLWIHEQNSIAGLSNRLLAPFSQRLLLGLPLSYVPWGWQHARLVGNPLRATLVRQPSVAVHQPLRLLVLGGSQGASFLNHRLPQVLHHWPACEAFDVWHQSGSPMHTEVVNTYQSLGISVKVDAFIEDMGAAYAWADVVIARAGALTVTEVMQVARPAIFIPFPHAVDNHQYSNALALTELGGATVVAQADATVDWLRNQLLDYLYNPERLKQAYRLLNALPENTAAVYVAQLLVRQFGEKLLEGEAS